MKCKTCTYQWETRIDIPKSCPRCKRRFDYVKKRELGVAA